MESFNPTTKTQAALTAALQSASSRAIRTIASAHLLVALLEQSDGIAAPLLKAVGVDPVMVRNEAQSLVDRLPRATGATTSPQLGREALAALTAAQRLATELDDEYVSTEHLLVGLSEGDSDVAKLLVGHGATARRRCARRSPLCAAARGSPVRTRRAPTRHWRSTRPISPRSPVRASSTR